MVLVAVSAVLRIHCLSDWESEFEFEFELELG